MLRSGKHVNPILAETVRYVTAVLGAPLHIRPVSESCLKKLPFLLRDAFDVQSGELRGADIVLLYPSDKRLHTPADLRRMSELIGHQMKKPPVLVLPDLPAWQRNRLIRLHVSFIVPGRQLYLPSLLMDLREHFPVERTHTALLSAPAQLVVLAHLQTGSLDGKSLAVLASRFSYSRMTMTRIVRDLENAGACRTTTEDRKKSIAFQYSGKQLWDYLRDRLSTPVKRLISVPRHGKETVLYRSGISALEHYTTLAGGTQKQYAIGPRLWEKLKPLVLPIDPGNDEQITAEVWRYEPAGLSRTEYVDPLSLYLSIDAGEDERVEKAREELLEVVAW
jgi:hypothetical protein